MCKAVVHMTHRQIKKTHSRSCQTKAERAMIMNLYIFNERTLGDYFLYMRTKMCVHSVAQG